MHRGQNRNSAPFSNKLIALESDDGWSVVGRKASLKPDGSKRQGSGTAKASPGPSLAADASFDRLHERLTIPQVQQIRDSLRSNDNCNQIEPFPNFAPKPAQCSSLDLQKQFRDIQNTWKASEARNQFKKTLEVYVQSPTARCINKAVCLGLGSLSTDRIRRDSMWQLAVFIDITELLSRDCSLVAQDPVFNLVDKEFLNQLNILVVESPSAFSNIDRQTFVCAPHYSVTWWPAQLRKGHCPLVVGNSVEKAIDRTPDENELLQIFRQAGYTDSGSCIADLHVKEELVRFNKCYSSVAFPSLDWHKYAFSDTRLFWLPDNQEIGSEIDKAL